MGSLEQETKRQYKKKTFANPMLSHGSPDQKAVRQNYKNIKTASAEH